MGSHSQIQCEIAVVMVQLRDGDPAIAHIYPISRHTSVWSFGKSSHWFFCLEWLSHGWVDVNPEAMVSMVPHRRWPRWPAGKCQTAAVVSGTMDFTTKKTMDKNGVYSTSWKWGFDQVQVGIFHNQVYDCNWIDWRDILMEREIVVSIRIAVRSCKLSPEK